MNCNDAVPAPFSLSTLPSERVSAVFGQLNAQLSSGGATGSSHPPKDGAFRTSCGETVPSADLEGIETDDEAVGPPQEAELDLDWQADGTICRAPGRVKKGQDTRNSEKQSPERAKPNGKICLEFSRYGQCHYKERCTFAHDLPKDEEIQRKMNWTHVSLENVKSGHNKADALAFLQDLQQRRAQEERTSAVPMVDEAPQKPIFRKPEKKEGVGSSKGECVFGQAKPRVTAKRSLVCVDDEIDDMD
eukprot:GEMP01063412.1.p1 GENE.GEMP01063412.1~~GEMP01063412.1.p1  ORF type:complete len:246 (+),score=78.68 GEMP01063412.1:108-845(+)